MLRQPLLKQATFLARYGTRATAQGAQLPTWAHVWRQVWARPPAWPLTGGRLLTTTPPRKAPVSSVSTSPFFRTRPAPRRTFHSSRTRRAQDKTSQTKSGPSSESGQGSGSGSAAAEPLTLSARLKKLSREYGWAAVGVYLGLSLLDFPFCFLLVRTLGTDKIAAAEEFVVSRVQTVIPASVKDYWRKYRAELRATKKDQASGPAADAAAEEADTVGWGVEEAEERNRHEASLATQLALAYAIHKSFIFVRVPLTAAVTPKVVRVLRSWGWKIGKQNPAV